MCLIKGIHLFGVGVVQELFVKKAMKKIVTRIRETDLWGDGSFMSEQDMKHEGFPECHGI